MKKINMQCREVERALWSLLDGSLDAVDSQKMQEHTEACADCRHLRQKLLLVFEHIENQKSGPSNPFLSTRILQAMHQEDHQRAGLIHTLTLRLLSLAAVALLAVFLGIRLIDRSPLLSGSQNLPVSTANSEIDVYSLADNDQDVYEQYLLNYSSNQQP